MPTTKQTGDKFEHSIAELYRAMGYEVCQNIPLCGQEIDIFVECHLPGVGLFKMIVECKYKSNQTLAGNADVQAIVGAFNIAKMNNLASACTIVTTNGFSLSAQEAAKAAGINLLTKRQLLVGLIDFSSYLNKLRAEFLDDFGQGESTWYIDPKVRRNNNEFDSLNTYVDNWIVSNPKQPLAILGGYGTGKTSFCRNYAVQLIEKKECPIPIIISLRDLDKAVKIESLIRDFLDEQCNTSAPRFQTFWRMYKEGMILLFFDGFDEMVARSDSSIIESNMIEIERFARVGGNVILTCRPEYFINIDEETFVFYPLSEPLSERKSIYDQIEIELWTSEQVSRYVEKRVKGMKPTPDQPVQYYLDSIDYVIENNDMSARAVHLDLLVKMLPNMINANLLINRTNLYSSYILKELRRETIQNKRLQLISDGDRLDLLRTLAADGFFNSNDNLNFEKATKIINAKLTLHKNEVESVTRDFLNRSFLKRRGDEYYFAHKSLGEYLLAEEIYKRIKNGIYELPVAMIYSDTVSGMVLDLFGGIESFNDLVTALQLESLVEFNITNLPRILIGAGAMSDYLSRFFNFTGKALNKITRDSLANLTHELRTPLTVIKGYIECIISGTIDINDDRYTNIYQKVINHWQRVQIGVNILQCIKFNSINGVVEISSNDNETDINEMIEQFVQVRKLMLQN